MMFTRLLEGLCTETDRREDVVRQRAGIVPWHHLPHSSSLDAVQALG